jgi:hypothetical protein
MTMKPIPKSLLALLARPWQPASQYSAFESAFEDKDRQRRPSFYFGYEGSRRPDDDFLAFKDVAALIREGALPAPLAALYTASSGDRQTSTNEHAQHAVIDFCEAVYAAWETLQGRLDQAGQACPIHPRDRQ